MENLFEFPTKILRISDNELMYLIAIAIIFKTQRFWVLMLEKS